MLTKSKCEIRLCFTYSLWIYRFCLGYRNKLGIVFNHKYLHLYSMSARKHFRFWRFSDFGISDKGYSTCISNSRSVFKVKDHILIFLYSRRVYKTLQTQCLWEVWKLNLLLGSSWKQAWFITVFIYIRYLTRYIAQEYFFNGATHIRVSRDSRQNSNHGHCNLRELGFHAF
jgi:hypothetical protein